MKHLITLTRHELRTLLYSPSTYIAAVLFHLLMGAVYFYVMLTYVQAEQEVPPGAVFFAAFPLAAFCLVPLLTMRSLAEERRVGTLETLMTAPVTPVEVIGSKFLAAYGLYALLWTSTLSYPVLVALFTSVDISRDPVLDRGASLGGLVFVLTSGLLLVAVGIFTSSLTRSQLVSGMLSFSALFVIIAGVVLVEQKDPQLGWFGNELLSYLRVYDHMQKFTEGLVDSRPFVFYVTNTVLVLGLASLVVERRH